MSLALSYQCQCWCPIGIDRSISAVFKRRNHGTCRVDRIYSVHKFSGDFGRWAIKIVGKKGCWFLKYFFHWINFKNININKYETDTEK